jgi:hypothetical protein
VKQHMGLDGHVLLQMNSGHASAILLEVCIEKVKTT